jgi:hypothetical protein
VIHFGKISHFVRDDGFLFLCRFERMREIFPRLRLGKADVAPGPYGPFPGFGFYRWYSSAWVGFYEPPRVNFYDIYISETSLYDVAKDRLVWSGIAKTTDLGDIGKEMKEYVEVVIRALNKKNLLTNQNRRVG